MRETRGIARFAWQEGYAAIAVSPERVEAVRRYVANQAEHHAEHGFDEELAAILRQAGIPVAPRD